MSGNELTILLLEDNSIEATLIAQMVREAQPQAKVLVARTVVEAQLLLEEFEPSFFIIDIHLPDGNGVDFLCDVQMTMPDSKSILITADPVPEYKEKARTLGVLTCLEKPITPAALAEAIDSQLGHRDTGIEMQFRGALSKLTPMDIIQLKCLSHSNTCLKFSVEPGTDGVIYTRDGEIIHAESGDKTGLDALATIVSWKHGRISETDDVFTGEPTLAGDWQMLMLNAVQQADEAA